MFNERLEDLTPNDGAFAFLSEVVTPLNAGGRCADRMPDLAVLSRYRRALDPDGVLYGVVHAIDESIYDLIDPSLEAGAPPTAGEKGVPGDLTAIEGIGERYAAALRQQGVTSIPGLAEVDLDAIRLAGVSRSRLEAWQCMARLKLARPQLSANALEFLVSGLGVRDPQEVEGVARSATAEAVASAVGRLKLPQDFDVGAVLASLRGTEI